MSPRAKASKKAPMAESASPRVELSTLYWDNTPHEQMRAHRAVMAHFGVDVTYYEENTPHGQWLDRVTAASTADVIGFFDSDCVPLSAERVQACIDYVVKHDTFCGIAQVANHILPRTHIYAAPAFFLITRRCWERLGRPSFVHNARSDVGEEITRAGEILGQRYRCLYPDSFEREPREGLWPLGNYGYYGIGTVFDQTVYHLYQGRFGSNLQLFIQRCDEIVAGTFSNAGHRSARLFDYDGHIVP